MDSKAHLAAEICSVSTIFLSCAHRPRPLRVSAYVDWYLILKVEEDAGVDAIRRRYRQLALQLHPDKNKHPKAEIAFKLVSEAYSCLSDKSRRHAFNSERCNRFCTECMKKNKSKPAGYTQSAIANEIKKNESQPRPRHRRNLRALREVMRIFEEEARVIEKCLRGYGAATNEFPLFDPSEYLVFPDYPHCRRVQFHRDPCRLNGDRLRSNGCRTGKCESPVYEIGPECHKRSAFQV